jgi:exopolysaccharide biosynthesis WecB/TagA/CpsF family protein
MHTRARTEFLQVAFDELTMPQILSQMRQVGAQMPFQFLVTPNVDHVVRLHSQSQEARMLARAYAAADYCVCDSKVLAILARLSKIRLPVVPGSDLTERLFAEVIEAGDRIAVVGGDAAMLGALQKRFHKIEFVLHIPPMGLLRNPAARTAAAEFVARANARFTFICVGSPQQEVIATEAASIEESRGVAFCVGASLDFLTARQKRAPALMRRIGLEWLHRLCTNPRRLWRRYLIEGPKIAILFVRWKRSRP